MFIVAHRGASAYSTENTLKAFKLAEAMNADAIELDVRQTKDAKLVVIHDPVVNRVSNGKGKVAGKTLAELKKLKVGSQRIPTLQEALRSTHLLTFVEVKEPETINAVLRVAKKYRKRVVIVSMHHEVLPIAKKAGFKVAAVCFTGFTSPVALKRLGADYVMCFKGILGKNFLHGCKTLGIKTLVWIVDTAQEAHRLGSWNTWGIVTNKPDVLNH